MLPIWGAALLVIVSVLVLWFRNRDVLRDVFDYSVVIAAAGKVEQGYKPYTDVRTPMQSSVYLLSDLSERMFGRDYAGLTLGGLVQGLAGGLLLLFLSYRALGVSLATGLSLAVVLAGLMQHVVFFYNPIGIWCLGVVLLGLAAEPTLWPVRSPRACLVLFALFLGGINKINFHGVTLVLAVLLSAASWLGGRIALSAAARNVRVLAVFGGILPVAFELAWTGATYAQWLEQVVFGPTARHAFLAQIISPAIYLSPAQDYYSHFLLRGIGGLGLGLLLATGCWLMIEARAGNRPAADWLLRGFLTVAGAVAAGALMITNHETVLLTSLAYPLIAAACYLQYRGAGRRAELWMRKILLMGTLVWSVAGGYAAWHGSRVLYGQNPPPREAYVRLESSRPAMAYFNGVRMLPEQIDAFERTAARLEAIERSEGMLQDVLFGAGQEWLERAYPRAIVRNAPIWLHAGTSLHDGDGAYFLELLDNGRRRLLVQRGWEAWPPEIGRILGEKYLAEEIGSRDVLYHPRGPRPPEAGPTSPISPPQLELRNVMESNVVMAATRWSEGMALEAAPAVAAWGAWRSSNWAWPLGSNALHGLAVARAAPELRETFKVTFRIMADDPERGRLLLEESMVVGPGRTGPELAFSLHAGGRPLWLQTIVPYEADGLVFAGWRELRITHSNEQDRSVPPAISAGLVRVSHVGRTEEAEELRYGPVDSGHSSEGWNHVPGEHWKRTEADAGLVRVVVQLRRNAARSGDPVSLMLAWYRAGRFEIMAERLVDPGTTTEAELSGNMPEPGGWIGVLGRHGTGEDRIRIVRWEQ